MSLYRVNKQFRDEVHQINILTQVDVPWELDSISRDFDVPRAVRLMKRTTGSWAPSYCTLTIDMAEPVEIESSLILVNFRQLEDFCSWLAAAQDTGMGLFRGDELNIYYHQAQLAIKE